MQEKVYAFLNHKEKKETLSRHFKTASFETQLTSFERFVEYFFKLRKFTKRLKSEKHRKDELCLKVAH